jgi:hypothetical protein
MDLFVLVVCAELCKIVPPLDGQPRDICLVRMEDHMQMAPKTRVMCASLDVPYGEVIDSAGTWTRRIPPWADPTRGHAD